MKTENSKQLFDRAMNVLVEGCSSASRGPMNYAPYPAYIREGRGARLWDVDGNEYIDWQLSFGCLPPGSCPSKNCRSGAGKGHGWHPFCHCA